MLTITDEHKPYAQNIANQLSQHGLRVIMDKSSDPISGQIKAAQIAKIPWMLIIGNKEVENDTIALRTRDGKQQFGLTIDKLLKISSESQ